MAEQDFVLMIDRAWDDRAALQPSPDLRQAVDHVLGELDAGHLRVAEKIDGVWHTHQWLKKAVLLSFRLHEAELVLGTPGRGNWFDKVPGKFVGWDERRFREAD